MTRLAGISRGRPTKFDYNAAMRITARMREGQSVKSASRAEGVNPRTFTGWCEADLCGLWSEYRRAQAILALIREDEAWAIAEVGGAEREIKWRLAFAERWLPQHLQPR